MGPVRVHLLEQPDDVIMHHLLWRLYHIDQKIGELGEAVANEKGSFDEFSERMTELENNLKAAKKEQAKMNKELMLREETIGRNRTIASLPSAFGEHTFTASAIGLICVVAVVIVPELNLVATSTAVSTNFALVGLDTFIATVIFSVIFAVPEILMAFKIINGEDMLAKLSLSESSQRVAFTSSASPAKSVVGSLALSLRALANAEQSGERLDYSRETELAADDDVQPIPVPIPVVSIAPVA
ncbi:hypothetical protein HK097_009324 [Rhizophlyctis rosea]|uniref:Uncharacterized protein n=1 Tax=Rhizophlyctis rosea TaxID=64517 RepID=A0AAD5X3B9_9FUNG|nr:hypothetical protein HK097_009324 [Rhizophlyctis rosea]